MQTFASAATLLLVAVLSGEAVAQEATKPSYDWSGFYIGGLVGTFDGGMDADNFTIDDTGVELDPLLNLDLIGAANGITAGFNQQYGQFVLGLEADYSWLNADAVDDRSGDRLAIIVATDVHKLATLRGRAGFAHNNILFFGSAGVATAETVGKLSDIYGSGTYSYSDPQTFNGWVAGGGVEVGMSARVSLKAEALYHALGTRTYSFAANPATPFEQITAEGVLSGWTVRAGMNFHF